MKRFSLIIMTITALISIQVKAAQPDSLIFKMQERPLPKWILPTSVASIGTAFLLDDVVQGDRSSTFLKNFSNVTDYAGDKYYLIPSVVAAYGVGRFILKDPKLQTTAWQSIQAVTITAITTEALKHLTGRARPFTGKDPFTFSPFPGNNDSYKSLPSGHASLTFAAFTPFAENYSRWIYVIPISVAFGRVYQNKHWFSDVVVGSSVGFISGWLFTHNKNVQLLPNGVIVKF
ncbi:MAG TPA: phosphatase PAP2 family protein [Marinilabiliaceae bacterium]|nr:phosphatase PAP2 family protein [Marinilabiliaceae bacterium]